MEDDSCLCLLDSSGEVQVMEDVCLLREDCLEEARTEPSTGKTRKWPSHGSLQSSLAHDCPVNQMSFFRRPWQGQQKNHPAELSSNCRIMSKQDSFHLRPLSFRMALHRTQKEKSKKHPQLQSLKTEVGEGFRQKSRSWPFSLGWDEIWWC